MTAPRRIVTFPDRTGYAPSNERWWAYYDGDEPNREGSMSHGSGATKGEAIAELIVNFPETEGAMQ